MAFLGFPLRAAAIRGGNVRDQIPGSAPEHGSQAVTLDHLARSAFETDI
jgi:hypothetical protein